MIKMLAVNFKQCSYVLRKGNHIGSQCTRSATGFCTICYDKRFIRKTPYHQILLENLRANNLSMILQCIEKFYYSPDEIYPLSPHPYWQPMVALWLKSKS